MFATILHYLGEEQNKSKGLSLSDKISKKMANLSPSPVDFWYNERATFKDAHTTCLQPTNFILVSLQK